MRRARKVPPAVVRHALWEAQRQTRPVCLWHGGFGVEATVKVHGWRDVAERGRVRGQACFGRPRGCCCSCHLRWPASLSADMFVFCCSAGVGAHAALHTPRRWQGKCPGHGCSAIGRSGSAITEACWCPKRKGRSSLKERRRALTGTHESRAPTKRSSVHRASWKVAPSRATPFYLSFAFPILEEFFKKGENKLEFFFFVSAQRKKKKTHRKWKRDWSFVNLANKMEKKKNLKARCGIENNNR